MSLCEGGHWLMCIGSAPAAAGSFVDVQMMKLGASAKVGRLLQVNFKSIAVMCRAAACLVGALIGDMAMLVARCTDQVQGVGTAGDHGFQGTRSKRLGFSLSRTVSSTWNWCRAMQPHMNPHPLTVQPHYAPDDVDIKRHLHEQGPHASEMTVSCCTLPALEIETRDSPTVHQ